MEKIKFAVVGAGHGGKAMAAHLAIKGFPVKLYNRTYSKIEPIVKMHGIEIEGEVNGFGRLEYVSDNIEEVIKDTDVIMVVVPAFAHGAIAERCAPYLKDGQTVILNPGRTAGALEFLNILKERGNYNKVTIAEAQTFIYASRGMGPASVKIFRIKQAIPVGAIPAIKTDAVIDLINEAFPEFISATSDAWALYLKYGCQYSAVGRGASGRGRCIGKSYRAIFSSLCHHATTQTRTERIQLFCRKAAL